MRTNAYKVIFIIDNEKVFWNHENSPEEIILKTAESSLFVDELHINLLAVALQQSEVVKSFTVNDIDWKNEMKALGFNPRFYSKWENSESFA
jgi:hypothetical protein